MLRRPAVAGMFYPRRASELREMIAGVTPQDVERRECLGCLAPHAGYIYSGRVAAEVYARITFPPTVVILSPNHRGPLIDFSLWPDGEWETPLGKVQVDAELARAIAAACPVISDDTSPHMFEHAAEVHVPFVQYHAPDAKIVPIIISTGDLDVLKEFGRGLAQAIKAHTNKVLVVASSDMTHQEPQEIAKQKDQLAIDRMLALDEDGLYETVRRRHISMCGIFPAVSMLACAKALGATSAELVLYQTSGDAIGDYSSVVGYAGVLVR